MTLPWYPRDMGKYARDTKHLTMMEHGAYNLLLDCYYSTGALPMLEHCSSNAELMPDHSRMYRVCSAMTKQEQDAVDAVLKMFFKLNNKGSYLHSMADRVIKEQAEKHANRVNAPKIAKAKKDKAMQEQCSSNTPQSKSKKETKTKTLAKEEEQEIFENSFTTLQGRKGEFKGEVIQLSGVEFDELCKRYSFNGDRDKFRAILQNRDDWYAKQPYKTYSKWLDDTVVWLAKGKREQQKAA